MAGQGSEVVFSIDSSASESEQWYHAWLFRNPKIGRFFKCPIVSFLVVKVRTRMKYRKLWLKSKNFQIGNGEDMRIESWKLA